MGDVIKMFSSIDKLITGAIKDSYFPGAVAYIEHEGEIVYHKAFGHAKVNFEKCLMNKEMIFDIASLTKIFISTLLFKLMEEKKVTLESKIYNWFPELRKIGKNITIKHLLTHTSGFPAWYPFYAVNGKKIFIEQLLDILKFDMKEPVGKVEYSDLNFIVIGKIIEQIEETSLEKVLLEKLVKPLEMETVQYNPITYMKKNIVCSELGNQVEKKMVKVGNLQFNQWRKGLICGEANDGNAYYYLNGISGHAGLFSNVHDIAKLARIYIHRDHINSLESYISIKLAEESYRNHTSEFLQRRGLGWDLGDGSMIGFGHAGFTGTSLWIVPDKNLIMVLLTNRLHQQNLTSINSIRKKFHKQVIELIE